MVFERAIPVRESIDARSGDGPDGRRRIGRTPAEGDVGTDNAPRAPPHASLPTQPDEGRDPALGEGVATADRSRQQTGGESRLLAAVAPDRHCDLRRVQAAAPRMQSSRRPGRRDRVRGKGIASPDQPRESKQSWRPQGPTGLDVRDHDRAPSLLNPDSEQAGSHSCVGRDRTDGRRDLDQVAAARLGEAVISSLPR